MGWIELARAMKYIDHSKKIHRKLIITIRICPESYHQPVSKYKINEEELLLPSGLVRLPNILNKVRLVEKTPTWSYRLNKASKTGQHNKHIEKKISSRILPYKYSSVLHWEYWTKRVHTYTNYLGIQPTM